MNNVPGVYKITCLSNKKVYIGGTVTLVTRLQQHKWHLKNKRHHNPILQASYNKYGPDNFRYEIIERCQKEDLLDREQFWIDFYNASNSFNVIPRADRKDMPEEVKRKISLANKGRLKSPAAREHMRLAQQNRSPEWKKAISEGQKGKAFSAECRKKMSDAKKGKRFGVLRPCECVDTKEVFVCLRDAERHFGIKIGTLHQALKNKCRCQGKIFRHKDEKNGREI